MRQVIHLFFKHLLLSFDTSLAEHFISIVGEEFSHGKLADVNINEVLETQLKLSVKKRVATKAINNNTAVVSQRAQNFLNKLRVYHNCLYGQVLAIRSGFG